MQARSIRNGLADVFSDIDFMLRDERTDVIGSGSASFAPHELVKQTARVGTQLVTDSLGHVL
jgi:hypothetical protein